MSAELPDTLRQSADLKTEVLDNGHFQIELLYLATLCDTDILRKEIAHPFFMTVDPETFHRVLDAAINCSLLAGDADLAPLLLDKSVIVQCQDRRYRMKTRNPVGSQPTEAVTETTLQGPQNAFSENAENNLMAIRVRYPSADLAAEKFKLGKITQTESYLIYDKHKVDANTLKQLKEKLDRIDADVVLSAGQIEALITRRKYRWLPTTIITERPDRVVLNLSQGKIVLILNGAPYTLILPAVFYDFISSMDDLYQNFLITRALVILRYISILITVTLPGLYVAVVSYNPEILKVQLALSIAGSRAAVPYPSFIEVLFMLFMIEALLEASLRLPRYIGATATTVGGLILGQAAQMAGLVSSIMIIVTSVVAIANFLIPINAMSFALRLAKYPLVLLSACFGVVGVVSGMFALALYIANLRSFGRPYFRLFTAELDTSGYKTRDAEAMD